MSREMIEDSRIEVVKPLPYRDVTPAIHEWMKFAFPFRSPKRLMLERGRKAKESKPRAVHQ